MLGSELANPVNGPENRSRGKRRSGGDEIPDGPKSTTAIPDDRNASCAQKIVVQLDRLKERLDTVDAELALIQNVDFRPFIELRNQISIVQKRRKETESRIFAKLVAIFEAVAEVAAAVSNSTNFIAGGYNVTIVPGNVGEKSEVILRHGNGDGKYCDLGKLYVRDLTLILNSMFRVIDEFPKNLEFYRSEFDEKLSFLKQMKAKVMAIGVESINPQ